METSLRRRRVDDWYRISFEGRSPHRLIQFTTGWDAIYRDVLFYEQLFVGYDFYPSEDLTATEMMPLYRSFVSQTQPGVEDPGVDLILTGKWKNQRGQWREMKPYPFGFGLAVELSQSLEPTTHEVVLPSGDVVSRPNFGLVILPDWTFWRSLKTTCQALGLDNLTEHVFKVTRSGPRFRHEYQFEPIASAIPLDIPAGSGIDLWTVLNELVNEDRLRAHVEPLPVGHCFWR